MEEPIRRSRRHQDSESDQEEAKSVRRGSRNHSFNSDDGNEKEIPKRKRTLTDNGDAIIEENGHAETNGAASTYEKRSSRMQRATTVATTDGSSETKQQQFKSTRSASTASDRKSSRSSSTDTEDHHHNHTASSIRDSWEKRTSSAHNTTPHKTKAFGGMTGAASLRSRFEGGANNFHRNKVERKPSTEGTEDDAPKRMSALSIKARFESMNTSNNNNNNNVKTPVKRNFVINKDRSNSGPRKFQSASSNSKCAVCEKTVYPMEKLEADAHVYHKFCFKCATCNRTVGLGSYAALQGKIYCKPHLKQLFKLKGNYDEGFGREQRKSDWVVKKDESAEKTAETDKENGVISNANNDVISNGNDDVIENGNGDVIENGENNDDVNDVDEASDNDVTPPESDEE